MGLLFVPNYVKKALTVFENIDPDTISLLKIAKGHYSVDGVTVCILRIFSDDALYILFVQSFEKISYQTVLK